MRGDPPGPVAEAPEVVPVAIREAQLDAPTDASASGSVQSFEKSFTDTTFARPYNTPSSRSFPFNSSIQSSPQMDMMFSYFDFLEAETLSHIAPDDFKFLEFKGCFHLPARPLLDDLVREYFLHVHPMLPVIDERAFWEMYFPSEGSGSRIVNRKVPLFVFRAMLFVSCSVSGK